MGLSAFWTAIKRPRITSESSLEPPRKHVDRVYDHHHKVAPIDIPGREPPHHFDAIYDTHHHILPAQNNGPRRHPSSPPRIHSPPMTKQNKKPSLWKSASLSVKPNQSTDGLKHGDSMKRRSFWRHERKDSAVAPAVQPPTPVEDKRKSKRNSYWLPGPENHRLLPTSEEGSTDLKAKRSSRRLSLRRTVSSQSSKRNSLRFSFLANGAGDSDDEDVPAVPVIPANIQRQKSRSKDTGRHMGVGGVGVVLPGTAVTSDDVYSAATPTKTRNSLKRQSLSRLITGRKSTNDLATSDQASSNNTSNKRKHRSWFSVHGSDSSPAETAIPPIPSLPTTTASGEPIHPSEAAFHAFLHNIHAAAPKSAVATDYERFLRASQAFDNSVTAPSYQQRNSFSEVHAPRPRPVSTAAPTALPQMGPGLSRSRRASRCRPQRSDNASSISTASPTNASLLSNEQQREWNKLRKLMDDGSQPSGSEPARSDRGSSDDGHGHGFGHEHEHEDDDGVLGMLRELKRDEIRESQMYEERRRREERRVSDREERRRSDREKYLGVGIFENKDALAALERRAFT